MNIFFYRLKWGGIFTFLLPSILAGYSPHTIRPKQSPAIISSYTLVDLGETDLSPEVLTRQRNGSSLGPSISNSGKIIGNRYSGGFVCRSTFLQYTPSLNGARLYFHDINDKEEVLLSLHNSPTSISWFLWPTITEWYTPWVPIDTVEQEGCKVDLIALNNCSSIAGEAHPDERSMPLEWSPTDGLYRIGYNFGLNLQGHIKGLNDLGSIIGNISSQHENFPFLWNGQQLISMFPLRKQFQIPPDGKLYFEDLLLTHDEHLYGTYWVNHQFDQTSSHSNEPYLAFWWNPLSGTVTLLDLDQLRFSAINRNHRIAGSLKQQAAYCDPGEKPLELISSIAQEEISDWDLLESTDINDAGQIVGYGRKKGKMHLFLANPL